jgi:hypothetical protein
MWLSCRSQPIDIFILEYFALLYIVRRINARFIQKQERKSFGVPIV